MQLYRYDSVNYTDTVRLQLRKFKVLRETPCGYWVIEDYFTTSKSDIENAYIEKRKKWVSKTGRKRLCYQTKELALESFKIRKQRHASILRHQLMIAEIAVNLDNDNQSMTKPDNLCYIEI